RPARRELTFGLLRERRSGRALVEDSHRLDVHKFVNSKGAELSSVSRLLDATERKPRIGRDHAVHEHAAGIERSRESLDLSRFARPNPGPQSKTRLIRQSDEMARVSPVPDKGARSQ